MTGMVKKLVERVVGQVVVTVVTVMGVRTEVLALLPQLMALVGGDGDPGSGAGDGSGEVREGDALKPHCPADS